MKKTILFVCLLGLGLVMALQYSAIAAVEAGCGKGCQGKNQQAQPLDAETQKKYEKFLQETVDLRKELDAKLVEYQALMASENPDPSKAALLTESYYQLRDVLTTKAIEAGLAQQRGGGCNGCSGKGGVACGLPGGQQAKAEVEKTN